MADVPLPLGSRTIPVPQLPASDSKGSQGLNRSSPLTHLLSSPLHSTPLHSTNSTDFGWSSHIASEQTHKEHRLQHPFYCCMTSPRMWLVPLLHVYGPLPSNRSTWYIMYAFSCSPFKKLSRTSILNLSHPTNHFIDEPVTLQQKQCFQQV
jgi:hypothetical protein